MGKSKATATGGKNRQALGDIGNLLAVYPATAIAEGKPLPQISRSITRSFGAQLLANAQTGLVAAAANEVSCGVTDKYEDPIPNIHSPDSGDQLAVVETLVGLGITCIFRRKSTKR